MSCHSGHQTSFLSHEYQPRLLAICADGLKETRNSSLAFTCTFKKLLRIMRHQFFGRMNMEFPTWSILKSHYHIVSAELHDPIHAPSTRCESNAFGNYQQRVGDSFAIRNHCRQCVYLRMYIMATKMMFNIAARKDFATP
jgi:hypothetical protein